MARAVKGFTAKETSTRRKRKYTRRAKTATARRKYTRRSVTAARQATATISMPLPKSPKAAFQVGFALAQFMNQ